jgi:predicted metal-dependent peptidase
MFISKAEELSIEDRLIAAKVQMLMRLPFFGSLASGLNIKVVDWMFDKETPITAATDGINFFYNPDGIKKFNLNELVWLFAHEVSHVCWQHFIRQGERNQTLWNIATDYAINGILRKNRIGKPPQKHLDDERFDGMCAEQIYAILYKESPKLDIDALSKMLADKHLEMDKNEDGSPKTEEQIRELTNKIKEDIIKATQSMEAGTTPVGMERLIESISSPQLPWQDILRDRIKSKIKSDFSFMQPNRRSSSMNGIILPSMTVEDQIDICVAMDMSGSIGSDTASEFMGELSGIISEFKSWNINLWTFDTRVYDQKQFSSEEDADILSYKPRGGGGTDFECNWSFMKANSIEPKLFIMFTDLYPCGGWGDPDYCDTLFVGYGGCRAVAPFGETIYIE